ncbi:MULTISPECIES: TonB-dependent receptor domain-containing protein [unclassified Helicobacter]|uniref:TonB-dependent receptor domain-containing protein n=1 Tax=unclassified Helicobacter TaxID=2593540 RepID=UPI000CF0E208|nr:MULTISPECIES: TonB-dependent receptor [unclassified Helicobacter]
MSKRYFGFILLVSYALSQEIVDKELDDINTTALKEFNANNKTYLSGKELDEKQVNNFSEVFSDQAAIDVGGGGMMAQKVYVRGIEDRLLRVSIDGSAQNGNAFHHQGNLLFDPSMLKSIEITKGAANASAGPGALAGSILLTTKDASDFLKPDQKFGFKLGTSFFSNFGIKENIALYGSDHKFFDLLVYYDFQDIFYYRDGKHTFTNLFHPTPDDKVLGSPSMQNNLLVKGNLFLTQKDKLTLSYNLTYDYATRPFRANITGVDPSLNNGVNFAQQLFKHKNTNNNFSLIYERMGGSEFNQPKIKATSYGSIRNVNLTPYQVVQNEEDKEGTTPRDIFLDNYGFDLNVIHPINRNNRNTFEYGLNYQGMIVMDKAQKIINANQRGREDAHIIGGYIQANYYILDNLNIGAGSRYDSYFYFDKNSQNHHTWGFSPSAIIIYNPIESMDIKVSYSYVTRGALPGDALLLQDDKILIDPKLKAEKGQNVELNIDYSNDNFAIRGAVFYQTIKDFINSYGRARENIGDYVIRNNLDSLINIYGVEAGIDYFYKDFLASFSFSRSFPTTRGRLLADTYELGATVGNTYIIKLAYDFKSIGLNLSWVSRFVQRVAYDGYDIYNDEISYIDKKGYSIHNIYLTYTNPKYKNYSLYFAIENLFNQYYINQASPFKVEADGSSNELINSVRKALPEPGLNVKITFGYKF